MYEARQRQIQTCLYDFLHRTAYPQSGALTISDCIQPLRRVFYKNDSEHYYFKKTCGPAQIPYVWNYMKFQFICLTPYLLNTQSAKIDLETTQWHKSLTLFYSRYKTSKVIFFCIFIQERNNNNKKTWHNCSYYWWESPNFPDETAIKLAHVKACIIV